MLRGLRHLGFSHVVATPHMRPGLFDNQKQNLVEKYREVCAHWATEPELPEHSLGSEHYFDDQVLVALKNYAGLPYAPGDPTEPRRGGGLLIEFYDLAPLSFIEQQLFELQAQGYLPVIAHPERYRAVWKDPEVLGRLVELGSVALLDVAAVVGKYGTRPQEAAQSLLRLGLYDAACSDAHRPSDLQAVQAGMRWIAEEYGQEELEFLFNEGAWALFAGRIPD